VQVEAFLADTVQAAGGKLSALGVGWTTISTGGLPARHDRIGVGVIVRLGAGEAGSHRLELRLLEPDGSERQLGRTPDGTDIGTLNAPFDVQGTGERTATFALNLDGLVFEREGAYTVVIGLDGLEAKRLSFRVQARPSDPPAEFRGGMYL
jgi:hypothetical protein